MLVQKADGAVDCVVSVVLPVEVGALSHLELKVLSAHGPHELDGLLVERVDRMGAACRERQVAIRNFGEGVEVELVEKAPSAPKPHHPGRSPGRCARPRCDRLSTTRDNFTSGVVDRPGCGRRALSGWPARRPR